jgi:2-amino-4-hydroxy-6-hydroxymethyldihydropteridine diphosphokinase
MTEALVALGSNLPSDQGDPAHTLREALARLSAEPGLAFAHNSRWFRTPAYPPGAGPDFVNGAAVFETDLPPQAALGALHRVEAELGRTRKERWAPRTCDLDLLGVGAEIAPDRATLRDWMDLDVATAPAQAPQRMILPHPRLHERAFVLVPLADIAATWVHPLLGLSVQEMLDALPESATEGIVPL